MITNQEHLSNLIAAAFGRELEIYQYQVNVDNYTVMLQSLPTDAFPEHLIQYKEAAIDRLPDGVDDETINLISDYQYRDRLRNLLRTEKVEQNKAIRIKDALKAQIGADYDSLIAAYKASQSQ
jgi:hypothetical protein